MYMYICTYIGLPCHYCGCFGVRRYGKVVEILLFLLLQLLLFLLLLCRWLVECRSPLQVIDTVKTSLRKGPSPMQTEIMFSNMVKLIGSLLRLQKKYALQLHQGQCSLLRPHLSGLQLHISKTVSGVLEEEDDMEVRLFEQDAACI